MPIVPADRPGAPTWLLIAGGGTGGHVYPGLTIADALVQHGRQRSSIHWLGSRIGVETDLVPAAGYSLTTLPGRGLNGRRIDLANLKAAFGLIRAAVAGAAEVRRRRPAVVLSLGGYAAFGGIAGAVLWRIPLVVAEQNAVASLTNRLAGRFARACAVAFGGTDLPRAVLTGNPVRPDVVAAREIALDPGRRAVVRAELGVDDDQILVAVMSGSLGSRVVNRAVIGMVERLGDRDDLAVRHVIGRRDWQTDHAPAPTGLPAGGLTYQALEYEDRPDRLLAAADLFIGRAGASTVAELAVVGVPSILVPLPIAPRDAQRRNAEPFVQAGAARVLDDVDCTAQRVADLVTELTGDPGQLATMASAARALGHPDAAARVVALLDEYASRD